MSIKYLIFESLNMQEIPTEMFFIEKFNFEYIEKQINNEGGRTRSVMHFTKKYKETNLKYK